jgi:hypothetical protein
MFVRLKLAGVDAPLTDAVTAYAPAVVFAVNTDELATPFVFVTSTSVFVPFANVPLAPDDGAVNVTFCPITPIPFCVTVAVSGAPNCIPFALDCGDPLVTAIARTGGGGGGGDGLELLPHPANHPAARKVISAPAPMRLINRLLLGGLTAVLQVRTKRIASRVKSIDPMNETSSLAGVC